MQIDKNFLNINPKDYKNIDQINIQMLNLIEYFSVSKKTKAINCFLKTYQIVTNTVINYNKNNKQYFNNYKELEKLDITFAIEFFEPLKMYLNNDKNLKSTAWKEYFEYIQKPNSIPFVQMLLGINAHINGDLAISLYKANVKDHKDFLKINKILINVTNKVLLNLIINHKDILSIPAIFIPFFAKIMFKKTIVNYRNIAWENYKNINNKNLESLQKQMYQQTNQLALEIINIFHTKNLLKLGVLPIMLIKIQPKVIKV